MMYPLQLLTHNLYLHWKKERFLDLVENHKPCCVV